MTKSLNKQTCPNKLFIVNSASSFRHGWPVPILIPKCLCLRLKNNFRGRSMITFRG